MARALWQHHRSQGEQIVTTYVDRGASISQCGLYRSVLWRTWDPNALRALWVMLNPSTADALEDDPTIRRCVSFSRSWGMGGIIVMNLFDYRATSPKDLAKRLKDGGDVHDPEPMCSIIGQLRAPHTGRAILAWGAQGSLVGRSSAFIQLLNRVLDAEVKAKVLTLGLTKHGEPKHPLYLRSDTTPRPFPWEEL